jgi:hypothetical protein
MTELAAVRAPFFTYFYWAIFLGFALGMALFLHRMIAMAAAEEEAIGMTTLSSYQEQVRAYRSSRADHGVSYPTELEDIESL